MPAWVWIVIALAVVVAAVAGWVAWKRRRTTHLRETFGPEYDRTVAESSSQREGEAALDDRRKRREELEIRPLTPEASQRYDEEWRAVQARFVDDPIGSVGDADGLVERVMAERGYPMEDFEVQAELVSVDHPEVVQNYRSAHEIYGAYGRGEASTEDLRGAMVHYRSLFKQLLESDGEEDGATESTPMEGVR
jgi:hypothetical protein